MSPKNAYNAVRGGVERGLERIASILPWPEKSPLPEDIITIKIREGKIPSIEDVQNSLGADDILVKAFYLNMALLQGKTRREGNMPYLHHVYSVANKPNYRFEDPLLPSRFNTTTSQRVLGLSHELREVGWETPKGSHVSGYIIPVFLGSAYADGVDDLTNDNDIVRKTIDNRLNVMKQNDLEKYRRLSDRDIISMLERRMNRFRTDEDGILKMYGQIRRSLLRFVYDLEHYHPELSAAEKQEIKDIMHGSFIQPISVKISNKDIISPLELTELVRADFQHVIEIINKGNYATVDDKLIFPTECNYLVILDETLYQDYLNRNMERAFNKVMAQTSAGRLVDDSALDGPIVKGVDAAANVATLEGDVARAINEFRKARRVIETENGLGVRLSQAGIDSQLYHKLYLVTDYVKRLLLDVLPDRLDGEEKSKKRDDAYHVRIDLWERMITTMSHDGDGNRNSPRKGIKGIFSL